MTLTEKILQHLQTLPDTFQAEVLDFIEYLESKLEKSEKGEEEKEWSTSSLSFAMQGMEDEYSPYSLDDIKELFR